MADANNNLLVHVSRPAMACEFEVRFPPGKYSQGTVCSLEALDLIEQLDRRLSYFRPDSEVSRINLLAAEQAVEVEPGLFDLLRLAMDVCQDTGGAYDITSAPLWEAWGFARRAGRIPSDAELADARSRVGGHFVELDPSRRTIRFRRPGMKINLGSIGKGHALDICAARLRASGMEDFLLHGGLSSVLARGSQPGVADKGAGQAWEIGIPHPGHPGQRLGIARLSDRAMGTSGGQFQSFRHRGRRYGHILDPRTGQPADGVASATVIAPAAALADALSTAFYVLGPDHSFEYCRTHPDIGLVMACRGPLHGGVELRTAGLGERIFVPTATP